MEENLKHDCTPANGAGKNQDAKQTIKELTDLIQSTNGLDENQAQTVIYFAIATYGLPHLGKFPLLVIYGPAGTGKTTILDVLSQLAFGTPKDLIPGDLTPAVLRDTLIDTPTALIDEADDVKEAMLRKRYSRQSSTSVVNQTGEQGGWSKVKGDLFGATALHRRIPFKDEAVQSRSIVVRTRKAEVDAFIAEEFAEFAPMLEAIAEQVDWVHVPKQGGERISDTWAPLLEVDAMLGGDWRPYAEEQMEAARKNLDYGHAVEPDKACYSALLSRAIDGRSVKSRVLIHDVVDAVSEVLNLDSWQVGLTLRDLGFETKTTGGKQYVYVGGKDKLVAIGRKLEVDDGWLDEAESAEGMKV